MRVEKLGKHWRRWQGILFDFVLKGQKEDREERETQMDRQDSLSKLRREQAEPVRENLWECVGG